MAADKLHLPEEILGHIVQCLDPLSPQNIQLLARLSLVSKQLQRLAEPFLYRAFPGQRHANPRLWLKGVLARPGRADFVRHITIHEFVRWRDEAADDESREAHHEEHSNREDEDDSGDDESSEEEHSASEDGLESDDDESSEEDLDQLTPREICLSSKDMSYGRLDPLDLDPQILQQLIDDAKVKPRIRARLHRALTEASARPSGSTNVDLLMSLIVLACPELDSIDIEICDAFGEALLPVALTSRNGVITEVNLHREGKRDNRGGQYAVETLASINVFERRDVKHLNIVNDSLNYIMDPGEQDIFGPWPSITSISCRDCVVPTPALEILLKGCPALSMLELRMERPLVHCGDLLREHGRGLERLVIDVDENLYADDLQLAYEMINGLYDLGDLRKLTRLKELEVALWGLLSSRHTARSSGNTTSVRTLPRSLQSLTLLPCFAVSDGRFEEEVELLRQDPAFANLVVCIRRPPPRNRREDFFRP